jgi:hypothetical protein
METELPKEFGSEKWREWKQKLLEGKYEEVEEEIQELKKKEYSYLMRVLINDTNTSPKGKELARTFKKKHRFRQLRNKIVQVFLGLGNRVSIHSWYGQYKEGVKKKRKPGPNGEGMHIPLAYWGFWKKYSPLFINHVVRAGVASGSYDLAEDELKERGYQIDSNQIDRLVQEVGEVVVAHRSSMHLQQGESLQGKRVMIAIDGGRIRTRKPKIGRRRKKQKLPGFHPEWKEPKLLVIAELDTEGKQKKDTPPIYEATMGDADALYILLYNLCKRLHLHKAAEIVCLGDGADWVWNTFDKLEKEATTTGKVTQIVDWYHAVEHLHEIAELHPRYRTQKAQQTWVDKLKQALYQGKVDLVIHWIRQEAKKHHTPELKKKSRYFEKKRDKMRYDIYRANNQPIGSGIVESAIRRVINLRLKSPGSFWKIERLERILTLRCALKAGRWRVVMRNFTRYNRDRVLMN